MTVLRWHTPAKKRYGEVDSYMIGADWLSGCSRVEDWGCGGGLLRKFLPEGVQYVGIDGTPQPAAAVIGDLAQLHRPSPGIMLRHVVDNTPYWRSVLRAALRSFTARLVVVTYTPEGKSEVHHRDPGGWPVWHLDPADLRLEMGSLLREEILTGHGPERVYLLERP